MFDLLSSHGCDVCFMGAAKVFKIERKLHQYIFIVQQADCGSGGMQKVLPWTGGDTSPAQPPFGPGRPGSQSQKAPIQMGAAWTYLPLLGASAQAGRCGDQGKPSHRTTRHSGTDGTGSVREDGSEVFIQ